MSVICGYCKKPARFESSSAHLYGGRDFGPVWDCRRCDAYVSCHPDGSPKGSLANRALRKARRRAHDAFDPLWLHVDAAYPMPRSRSGKLRRIARNRAYEWLAHHMGLPFEATHIAMFDEAQCARAVELIEQHQPTSVTIRAWAKARADQHAEGALPS